MPTVYRERGYSFYFYAEEGNEQPHIHADKGNGTAKFWLDPLRLAYAEGLKVSELRTAEGIARKHRAMFLEKWDEFFGGQS